VKDKDQLISPVNNKETGALRDDLVTHPFPRFNFGFCIFKKNFYG